MATLIKIVLTQLKRLPVLLLGAGAAATYASKEDLPSSRHQPLEDAKTSKPGFEHDAQPMTFLSRLTLAWGSKPDTPASSSEGSTSKTLQELTPFKPAVRSETLPGASLSGLSAESVNAVFTALVRDPLFQFLSSHDTEGPRPLAEPTVKPMQEALHDYVNLQSSTPKAPATATWQSGSAGPSATTAQQQQQQQQQGVSSRNSVSSSQSSFSEQDALLAFANLGSGSTSRPVGHAEQQSK